MKSKFLSPITYPVQRGLMINGDGFVEPAWPENQRVRSQDLPAVYHDSGMFYITRPENVIKFGRLSAWVCTPIEVPEMESQDIDDLVDWMLAELKFSMRRNHNG